MTKDFDPYQSWLSIPPDQQPPDHYRLLGINQYEPSLKIIERAVNERVELLQALSNGPHVEHAQRILNEIAKARVCLTDSRKKSAYDRQLQNPPTPQPGDTAPASSPTKPQIVSEGKSRKRTSQSTGKSIPSRKKKAPPKKRTPVFPIAAALGTLIVLGAVIAAVVNLSTGNPEKAATGPETGLPDSKLEKAPPENNLPESKLPETPLKQKTNGKTKSSPEKTDQSKKEAATCGFAKKNTREIQG